MYSKTKNEEKLDLIDQIDSLSEEVRILAVNLAIYLAKTKAESEELSQLEPDFIRLVNGTVAVLQEIESIIAAARNMEMMVYDVPSGKFHRDQIEIRLRSILDQCGRIMTALGKGEKIK